MFTTVRLIIRSRKDARCCLMVVADADAVWKPGAGVILVTFCYNKKCFFMQKTIQQYQSCIDACLRCASVCDNCASSCLHEEHVHMMARCIQLDMECATVCYTAAKLMSI